MAKLVISLATRGRPAQLIDTINRSLANWTDPATVMQVQLDADDAESIMHLNANAPHGWFVGPNGARVTLNVQNREDTIAAKWNRAMAIPADVYLVAADDDPYVTPGYDSLILEAAKLFPDGIGMVYGHMANASFSCMVAPTAKLVEKLGYIQPEYFSYWFVDHWTDDISRLIGRIAVADVKTDQSKVGRTQEMREPAWWATWFDAGHLYRRKLAHAIIDGPDFHESESTKARLKTLHPRVEFYSKWINDNVRAQATQFEWVNRHLKLDDERYQRVRQKAVAMVPMLLDGMEAQAAQQYLKILCPPAQIANLKRAYA
jgi:hypothetical protein